MNDLSRDLGPLEWTWEVEVDGETVAGGSGETEVPADSVRRVGEVKTMLSNAGKGVLTLSLSGDGVSEKNAYGFAVTSRRGP